MFQTTRFSAFADLTAEEIDALRALGGHVSELRPGQTLRFEGDPGPGIFYLHEGWAISSVSLVDGGRQIVKIHLAGDVLGAPSLPYDASVETLTALTACKVSPIPMRGLGEIFRSFPRLAALFFLAAQEERVFLMDRLTALGRRGAKGSLEAFLVHLHDRLAQSLPSDGGRILVPLTQVQIADVLGLTVVHVNRVMRQLERDGDIVRIGRSFHLMDVERLRGSTLLPERKVARNLSWLPAPNPK